MESAEAGKMHKTASTQSFDSETGAQPALPNLMRFPSACSTPVSSSDIIAMENLRKKASAGKGGERPGRYGENDNQLMACVNECVLVMRNVPSAPHGVRRNRAVRVVYCLVSFCHGHFAQQH